MIAFTFTGDFRAGEQARFVFQLFSIALIVLSAGYFAAGRVQVRPQQAKPLARRHLFLGIVLLTSGALGWVAASNLYAYSREIETLLASIANPQDEADSVGFSGNGRLGSVARQKANAGRRVALRVYADNSPGYLRGRAFTTYSRTEWHADSKRITLSPETDATPKGGNATKHGDLRTFPVISMDLDACDRLEIWPNQPFREFVFVPLGLAALQIPVDALSIDMNGIIEADDLLSGTSYVALRMTETARSPDPLTANEYAPPLPQLNWELLTALPEDLDPRILELAASIADHATTASEKIAAVEQYFQDNYEYQFGINIPSGADPLTHFLLEKPPAHCEYFASGAAILLRSVGVPCRYVTGYVAAERNDYGDYWIARNRDAHAWVEAFDPEQGWVLVEATPVGGVPQAGSASTASQMWDSVRAQWQRLIVSIRRDGVRAVLGWLVRWLGRPWFLAVLLLAVAGITLRRLWRRRSRTPAQPTDPCVIQLKKLLKAMDQRWHNAGLTRQPHETYHQFAERITSTASDPACQRAAQWYRQYATIRFSGQVDARSVQMLQDTLTCVDED